MVRGCRAVRFVATCDDRAVHIVVGAIMILGFRAMRSWLHLRWLGWSAKGGRPMSTFPGSTTMEIATRLQAGAMRQPEQFPNSDQRNIPTELPGLELCQIEPRHLRTCRMG
jgi:hypothetical protein